MNSPPKQLTGADMEAMQNALLEWYAEVGRTFTWRESSDPYAILILEVMSQQTQLHRVEVAWEAFMDRWPTPEALAESSPGDVIAFWSEHRLGYNRRAEYLHRAAKHIVSTWDGSLPSDPETLQELDGVGPYTSRAVASFAFNHPCAVVDTNVKRILQRIVGTEEVDIESFAQALLPESDPHSWNNAMMDLGATICTSSPACDDAPCPWRQWCIAYEVNQFDVSERSPSSSFIGSRRQFRGAIIRMLAQTDQLDLDTVYHRLHSNEDIPVECTRDDLISILDDLVSEGLVVFAEDQQAISLPD